jgi:hypothetical protein
MSVLPSKGDVAVSETFNGSPITLDYHFTITNGQIVSLAIE